MTYIALLYRLFSIAKWPFWMKKEAFREKHLTTYLDIDQTSMCRDSQPREVFAKHLT